MWNHTGYSLPQTLQLNPSSTQPNNPHISGLSLRIVGNQWQQHSSVHHCVRTSTSEYPALEVARSAASIRRRIVHHSSASSAGRRTQIISIVVRASIDASDEVRAPRIRRRCSRASSVAIEVCDVLSDEVQIAINSKHLTWIRAGRHSLRWLGKDAECACVVLSGAVCGCERRGCVGRRHGCLCSLDDDGCDLQR